MLKFQTRYLFKVWRKIFDNNAECVFSYTTNTKREGELLAKKECVSLYQECKRIRKQRYWDDPNQFSFRVWYTCEEIYEVIENS